MATTYQSDELAKFGEEGLEPMHPSSQCLNGQLSLCIIGIAESEIPIDVDKIMPPLRSDLLLVSPGFSSIVVRKNGQQWWKRVEVQFEDHVVIPTFPPNLSPESYTKHFDEYFSKISLDKLPETRPLWELHIIKYPTQNAAGTLVFKMHHALGDGFSIMGAIFSMLKRADNPSLPLTFPSASSAPKEIKENNILKSGLGLVSRCFYTVSDTVSSMMHTAWFGDKRSAIRSGTPSVEYLPMHTTKITLSLDDIRKVQSKIHVSVNDVVVGMIFYGTHLYTKMVEKSSTESQKTALVVLNTRMLDGYRNLDEMLEKNLWGNKFSFIHIPLPTHSDGEKADLTSSILEARKIIQRNRNSMAVILNGLLLALMDKLKGSEAVSKYVYTTMNNCSICVSNLIGPKEKLAIADHPISSIFFTVAGVPMSLIFPVISYMGKLTIGISGEKNLIDTQLLASCMTEAFKKILEETSM
ncbi:O-acyltransferase wsd1 [Thalictrum thalictroides]|uniref:O-acyltransferase wsd1 n=1 Tax=Thalictrum thalictroides TaxID=46969 RepID=A0A7J6UVM7_THATH|nr:O-acyltransferase wsd1 [Thalictrum thalictroides]